MVLEDAADERQVQPLLTATAGSAVIITSRRRLTVHDRTVHIELAPLCLTDSMDLLAGLYGEGHDRRTLDRIAHECAGYPRALRLAAATTGMRPRAAGHT